MNIKITMRVKYYYDGVIQTFLANKLELPDDEKQTGYKLSNDEDSIIIPLDSIISIKLDNTTLGRM